MASKRDYPDTVSEVEVIFNDGEVKKYYVRAGAGISSFLARQAGDTGILTLLAGPRTYNIPMENIREYTISEMPINFEIPGEGTP